VDELVYSLVNVAAVERKVNALMLLQLCTPLGMTVAHLLNLHVGNQTHELRRLNAGDLTDLLDHTVDLFEDPEIKIDKILGDFLPSLEREQVVASNASEVSEDFSQERSWLFLHEP